MKKAIIIFIDFILTLILLAISWVVVVSSAMDSWHMPPLYLIFILITYLVSIILSFYYSNKNNSIFVAISPLLIILLLFTYYTRNLIKEKFYSTSEEGGT